MECFRALGKNLLQCPDSSKVFKFAEYSICPMAEEDLELVLRWRNSERIHSMMLTEHLITWEEHKAWFKACRKAEDVENFVFYIGNNAIGVTNITNIDNKNRTCSWSIYIGEENAPKGAGYAMGKLVLQYIFEQLDLCKVYVEIIESNARSLQFHKNLGFLKEGIQRKHILENGKYEDVILLSILKPTI